MKKLVVCAHCRRDVKPHETCSSCQGQICKSCGKRRVTPIGNCAIHGTGKGVLGKNVYLYWIEVKEIPKRRRRCICQKCYQALSDIQRQEFEPYKIRPICPRNQ